MRLGFGRPKSLDRRATAGTVRKHLQATGWEVWGASQPYMDFGCKNSDHGTIFVGKIQGDHIPMESIAATAAQFHVFAVMLTQNDPSVAANEYMMQRGCFLLRQDRIDLLSDCLILLELDKRRRQEVMSSSVSVSPEDELHFSAASLIQQVYRALLRRDPSQSDIEHFRARVTGANAAKGIEGFTSLVSSSPEFRARQVADAAETTIAFIDKTTPSKYSACVSFGTHCATGKLLQREGLKKMSTPFDWVFCSPRMIAHCLLDDFRTFLDPTQYEAVQTGHGLAAEHLRYRDEFGVKHLFNHRSPTEDKHYDYYVRSVDRYRKLVSDAQPFLCLTMTYASRTSLGDIEVLVDAMSQTAPSATLAAVRFHNRSEHDGTAFGYKKVKAFGDRHQVFDFFAAGALGSLSFEQEVDAVTAMMLVRTLWLER